MKTKLELLAEDIEAMTNLMVEKLQARLTGPMTEREKAMVSVMAEVIVTSLDVIESRD